MQPAIRHGPLLRELERSLAEQTLRIVLLHAPRGMGKSQVLLAFAEELKTLKVRPERLDMEALGDFDGAGLDAWLRGRLGLPTEADAGDINEALESTFPALDAISHEFLSFVLGVTEPDAQTARLDHQARWEGALAELDRRLLQSMSAPWALLVDHAPLADNETLSFIALVAGRAWQTPGLVVLVARDDQVTGDFEAVIKKLRGTGRLTDVALPLPPMGDLEKRFRPEVLEAARGNPFLAACYQSGYLQPPYPITLDQTVVALVAALPQPLQDLVDCLALVGGRLPMRGIETIVGADAADGVVQLAELGLVSVGATPRFPGDAEVQLRFRHLLAARRLNAMAHRDWLEAAMAWGDAHVVSADERWRTRAPLVSMVLVWAAEAMGSGVAASFAREMASRGPGGVEALKTAEMGAGGVRKLVLTRRLVEEAVFRGAMAEALELATAGLRVSLAPPANAPSGWERAIFFDVRDELDRWDRLSPDEALAALELAKAEVYSQLGRTEDTRRSFEALETKLSSLSGPAASALWMRWARTWSWFQAEVHGDGAAARRVCELVRKHVPADELKDSVHALAFVRAEQVAASRGGDTVHARALADELIELASSRGDTREECVAWNARALLSLRDGELNLARAGFEQSMDLARAIGFRRREAIALHNLGLVLFNLGEYGAAEACQDKYLALSRVIGNRMAEAYGTAALAQVYVMQADEEQANRYLHLSRKAIEDNGWEALLPWVRFLAGQQKLLQAVARRDKLQLSLARADFVACLDLLEDRQGGWSEELDPAEASVMLALAYRLSNNEAQARVHLKKAQTFRHESPASTAWVFAGEAVLDGERPVKALEYFDAAGYQRALHFWQRVLPALKLSVDARL